MSPINNHEAYRGRVATAAGFQLPYLAVTLKDIMSTDNAYEVSCCPGLTGLTGRAGTRASSTSSSSPASRTSSRVSRRSRWVLSPHLTQAVRHDLHADTHFIAALLSAVKVWACPPRAPPTSSSSLLSPSSLGVLWHLIVSITPTSPQMRHRSEKDLYDISLMREPRVSGQATMPSAPAQVPPAPLPCPGPPPPLPPCCPSPPPLPSPKRTPSLFLSHPFILSFLHCASQAPQLS
jgi:hypothetical protein